MKVPKDVLDKANAALKEHKANVARAKQRDEAAKKAVQERRDFIKQNYPKSIVRARFIAKWVNDFYKDSDGKVLLSAKDGLCVFCSTFWEGEPRPKEQSSTTFAYIELRLTGVIVYAERYKWHPAHEEFRWHWPLKPHDLASKLHPQYLEEWEAAINSGDVWKYVRNSIN